jgi:exosome complex component RRP4
MPDLRRRFVIPGEVVARGNQRAETNVMRVGDKIVSTRVGMAELAHDAVRVVPLSGPYIPRIDDLVVGKVIDYSAFAWEADINSCFFGILPAQSVFGRDYSPAKDSLTDKLAVGDMIAAKVIAFDRTRDPLLSISGPGLGRIPRGQTVKISPAKVPRLIGKKGSMIRTIEQGSNCRMLIGQNGIVVVVGATEDILRAINAVNLVENQAHSPDLTDRVMKLLGMTAPPGQQGSGEGQEQQLSPDQGEPGDQETGVQVENNNNATNTDSSGLEVGNSTSTEGVVASES